MIDLNQLRDAIYKRAAELKDSERNTDAMADAAAAAKPSWAPSVPDFRKFNEEDEDEEGQDLQKVLDKKDKELEQLKREKRIVEQNLEFEQIKARLAEAINAVEQRERQSLEKLRQEQQKLDLSKILAQADEIKHQSKLQQQESNSQLKVQQDKNKALMDLHNQGMKLLMQQADQARSIADKYKDEARKQIDKERQEVYKQYDKDRLDMYTLMEKQRQLLLQQYQKSNSGMSPALKSLMNSANSTLSQFNKPHAQKIPNVKPVKIPKPAAQPLQAGMLQPIELQATQGRLPDSSPIDKNMQIPVPGRTPINKTAATAVRQDEVPSGHGSPFSNDFFGYPEIGSTLLGAVLGPIFNYANTVSRYKRTTNKDSVVYPESFINEYAKHGTDPRWLAANNRGYRLPPGPHSIKYSGGNNWSTTV